MNITPNTVLSTQELAILLNVTETTVKRWADVGQIKCTKTLGGHRKFNISDVISFAEKNGYTLLGLLPPPMDNEQMEQLQFAVMTKNYSKISEVFLQEALQGDREGLVTLLLYLIRHQIGFPTITDEIIRSALVKIGDMWEKGDIDINQEHRASHAVSEAMIRILPSLYRKPSNGLSILCACPEGEYHEIGLKGLAYSFETEGWKVHYIGANTPSSSLISFIKRYKPELVALSFTIVKDKKKLFGEFGIISKHIHSYGGKFIAGGFYSGNYTEKEIHCDQIILSSTEAIAYARDVFNLQPGPKKGAKSSKNN
ncbi:MAG: cobalamin B12-binding domain-containing protein [Ignavibacteriales bacterium]|nr:cobalamin B12-binding domain-containing protein [Ignavibacteriales bacterium]